MTGNKVKKPKKVYLVYVESVPYCDDLIAIFSSRSKAEKYIKMLKSAGSQSDFRHCWVEEWVVDDVEGEK